MTPVSTGEQWKAALPNLYLAHYYCLFSSLCSFTLSLFAFSNFPFMFLSLSSVLFHLPLSFSRRTRKSVSYLFPLSAAERFRADTESLGEKKSRRSDFFGRSVLGTISRRQQRLPALSRTPVSAKMKTQLINNKVLFYWTCRFEVQDVSSLSFALCLSFF